MIEVVTHASYSSHLRLDTAECDTPSDALAAAHTLLAEARDAGYGKPCASFYVDGKLIRARISLPALDYHLEVLNHATKES